MVRAGAELSASFRGEALQDFFSLVLASGCKDEYTVQFEIPHVASMLKRSGISLAPSGGNLKRSRRSLNGQSSSYSQASRISGLSSISFQALFVVFVDGCQYAIQWLLRVGLSARLFRLHVLRVRPTCAVGHLMMRAIFPLVSQVKVLGSYCLWLQD
jgi:hypothetical protein